MENNIIIKNDNKIELYKQGKKLLIKIIFLKICQILWKIKNSMIFLKNI